METVRQALRSKISQWQSDQLAADQSSHERHSGGDLDSGMISRVAQQHEEMSLRHLELAFNHWNTLPHETRREAWQLEITRAFAREIEKRKSVDEQLARVQQEANQLRAQVERLGSCQWPREFALFPPDTLPLSRDVARELDAQEGPLSANSERWDYENVVTKWKRVVMHDKGMGRIGVGSTAHASSGMESDNAQQGASPDVRPPASSHPNRLRPLQPRVVVSPDANTGSTPPSSTNYTSPYSHVDPRSPPGGAAAGPQAKRPRLMNGSEGSGALPAETSAAKPSGP